MTKRNLTLGTASGKLGSVVYFRRRGQQIARVLVSSINDRKSLAQCEQRARFANSVALWRLLRPYVGVSWRGVSRYGSPENAFYHHNRGLMPTCSKNMSRSGYAFPSLGIISYGSLSVDVPLIARQVVGTGTYTGIFPFSILTQFIPTQPTDAATLFNIFKRSSQGIDDSDVIHILAMAYGATDSPSQAIAAAEQYAPKVYHVAFGSSTPSLSLSVLAPWLKCGPAATADNVAALGLGLEAAWLPQEPDAGFIDYVFALFVERPNNPSYARFSRSRFIGNSTIIDTLNNLCKSSYLSGMFADTFRNV